jgi:toxin ParE1/3/4
VIVRYSVRAAADIDAMVSYIRERSPDGARNVLYAIYAGVQLIVEQPLASPVTDDSNVRVKVIQRYRYKIFYSVSADVIEILHIRHSSRAPVIIRTPK